MEIAHLQAFVQIAERGSFSAAADALELTQPAISKRIASLENQFAVRLFDRAGRDVRLTEPGRLLLPKAREIIQALEQSRFLIENLGENVRGNLRLAVTHHIGLHRLPTILEKFRRQYADVALKLQFMDSAEAARILDSGSAEIALATLPDTVPDNLVAVPLWDDVLLPTCSEGHPLADAEDVDLKTLAQHDAIFPDHNTRTRRIINTRFAKQALRPKVVMETNYLETLLMMARIGLGWTILPEIMINQTGMHRIDMKKPIKLNRRLGLLRRRDWSVSKPAQAMIDTLTENDH